MELKDNCKILLERSTQKVKCFKFQNSEIERELALHEDTEDRNKSAISDVNTGFRLITISKKVKDIKEADITDQLQRFINHYTKEAVCNKLNEMDKTPMEDKFKKVKK